MSKKTDFSKLATQYPNYFPGQYLLEADFELQHKYLSDRLKYHRQSLYVSGIVEGLEVEVDSKKKSVIIKAGSAIDSNGNLIVLKKERSFLEFNNLSEGELYLQYFQEKDAQQQEEIKDSYTRWKEEPTIKLAANTPEDGVKIAKLAISPDNIKLDLDLREYSGLSIPNSNGKALTFRSQGNINSNRAVLSGSLKIDGNLTVDGQINGQINIINQEEKADGKTLVLGSTDKSNLRLGYHQDYSWIQSHQGKPLAINPIGNKVGIGTVNPSEKLEVDGNIKASGNLTVNGIISGKIDANQINSGTLNIARIPDLSANKITSGTLNVARIPNLSANKIISGKVTGNLSISGAITPSVGNSTENGIMFPTNPGGGSGDAAWIRYYRRGTSGEATTLEIGTSDNTDDHIALMPNQGNVGIGTANPEELLHISSEGKAVLRLEADINNSNENNNPLIQLLQDGRKVGVNIGFDNNTFGSNIFGIGRIWTDNPIDSKNTFIINTSNGNIGINTNNPKEKLEVDGNIKAKDISGSGNLTVDGTISGQLEIKSRIGIFKTGKVAADGNWHNILSGLNGHNGFEVIADVGKPGKHGLTHAIALSTYIGNGESGGITKTQAHYNGASNSIDIRWQGTTYKYNLQIRTLSNYASSEKITYHITKLWG